MSTPFDPNPGNQQYGQPPQFGAPVPPGPQQPPQPAPAWGTQPTAPYPDPNANPYGAGNPYQQPYAGVPMQQKPAKQRGTGVAGVLAVLFRTVIGRIVIFALIAGGIAVYHFVTNDSAQRNATGQVSQAGSVQATDLKVGDCFDAPTGTSSISSVKAIPCTQAHDSQVYDEPPITETSFPGASTLESEGQTACNSTNAQSSISSSAPSSLQPEIFYPEDDSTFAQQNYFICSLTSSTANLTQSYVG